MSQSVFIFSYNNIGDINPILLDRLVNIKISSFKVEDKLSIANNYLIPAIQRKLGLDKDNICFDEESIKYIIENFTDEEGVRTLKKNIDSICCKINVFMITDNKEILPYDIGELQYPFMINDNIINALLLKEEKTESIPFMYM